MIRETPGVRKQRRGLILMLWLTKGTYESYLIGFGSSLGQQREVSVEG